MSFEIPLGLYVCDVNDNPIPLIDLINCKKRLILRYSELNCQVCIDSLIQTLKCSPDLLNSVIVISNYSQTRDLLSFLQINQVPFPVYNLKELQLTKIDNYELPYFIQTDTCTRLFNAFIPDKTLPAFTRIYIQTFENHLK